MSEVQATLFLHALSSIHAGTGQALGVVDNPIQREVHTGWPLIQSSSVKGVLRSMFKSPLKGDIFGSDKRERENTWAGAVAFGDARILAFPVRSLKGCFAWVTCPSVLRRCRRDLSLAGKTLPEWVGELNENQLRCAPNSPLVHEGKAVLEEFAFDVQGEGQGFGQQLAKLLFTDPSDASDFIRRLAIVDDSAFGHFVTHCTEITARNALDENKNTQGGALFYSENCPTETLFYVPLYAVNSRRGAEAVSAGELLTTLKEQLEGRVLSFGAHESLGMGLCRLHFAGAPA